MEETQGTMTERHATNGVDRCHLDDLAQRKHVEIHEVHLGNKWMGSLNLDTLNETTSQTAGQGLKTIKTRQQPANMMKQASELSVSVLWLSI